MGITTIRYNFSNDYNAKITSKSELHREKIQWIQLFTVENGSGDLLSLGVTINSSTQFERAIGKCICGTRHFHLSTNPVRAKRRGKILPTL